MNLLLQCTTAAIRILVLTFVAIPCSFAESPPPISAVAEQNLEKAIEQYIRSHPEVLGSFSFL